MRDDLKLVRWIEANFKNPTGPNAGQPSKVPRYLREFYRGTFSKGIRISALSVARGQAKSVAGAWMAVAELMGVLNDQPRREVIIAARTRDQAEVLWTYCLDFVRQLPEEVQLDIDVKVSPKLEIIYKGEHKIRAVAADAKNLYGLSPTLVIEDEAGNWEIGKGQELHASLLTGMIKRDGRMAIFSTSAPTDAHPFSVLLDDKEDPTLYTQEHRAPLELEPGDPRAILAANPGCALGIGPSMESLQASARRAIRRGGPDLANYRLLHLNQRVSDESREPVVNVDDWMAVETEELPSRKGPCIIGLDLGGSASMSAAAYFWAESGRLEVRGWFPSRPGLEARGQRDGVGGRYVQMRSEGTLQTLGESVVPVGDWIKAVLAHVEGQPVAAVCFDTFKESEIGDGLRAADCRAQWVQRRFGPFHGGEDLERFRRAVYSREIRTRPTLLMRSALADAVCKRDGNLNPCLDKGRSTGRIDPVSAAVLAVAEGSRRMARPAPKGGRVLWV